MTNRIHFDVLVIGNPCVDIVFGGMPHWPVLGQEMYVDKFGISAGGIFNTAATLSRLGLRVALLCELGNDFFSRFMLEEIEKAGICSDLVLRRDHPMFSVSVCLAHENERGFVSYSNTQSGLVTHLLGKTPSAQIDGEGVSIVEHVARDPNKALDGYTFNAAFFYARPTILPLANFVVERGSTLFLDTGWHSQELPDPNMPAVVKRGNYIMPNQLEAMLMTGSGSAEEAVRKLAEWASTAIVKIGAQGVVACQQEELVYCDAYPINEVVDTTGAGDAFNGGFIYGILKGYSLLEALRCGTICGSLSTTALTGTAAVPTGDELERLLRSAR
ncbi:MAG TPA: carbohydrate kinase family protein [Ktedonobacteraceae bacterium]|nr:carbohydrate kinase family protein [Ktedonobacteraceae bacterium]